MNKNRLKIVGIIGAVIVAMIVYKKIWEEMNGKNPSKKVDDQPQPEPPYKDRRAYSRPSKDLN